MANAGGGSHKELYRLIRKAFTAYKTEVVANGTLYHVYVMEFLNSNQYADRTDAASLNEHQLNYGIVSYILNQRKDLVSEMFEGDELSDLRIEKLIHFYRTTYSATSLSEESAGTSSLPHYKSSECYFSDEQMNLIAQCVNEAHLFDETVDAETMHSLFHGKLQKPLKSHNNRRIAFFFDRLCHYRLITGKWQSILEENKAIVCPKGGRCLRDTDFSSALNRSKSHPDNVQVMINEMVKHIQEMQPNN